MQTASFRIWTLVVVSISYDDNHYTMSTYICVQNMLYILNSHSTNIGGNNEKPIILPSGMGK